MKESLSDCAVKCQSKKKKRNFCRHICVFSKTIDFLFPERRNDLNNTEAALLHPRLTKLESCFCSIVGQNPVLKKILLLMHEFTLWGITSLGKMPCRICLSPDTSHQSTASIHHPNMKTYLMPFLQLQHSSNGHCGLWLLIWFHKMVHKSLFTLWPFETYGCAQFIMFIPRGVGQRKKGTENTEPSCEEGQQRY